MDTPATQDTQITGKPTLQSVLVLEDNPYDQKMIRKGVKRARNQIHVKTIETVGEAITYLCLCDLEEQKPDSSGYSGRPDLIFLDLSLPGIYDGGDFLAELRKDKIYKFIPVIVVSGSDRKTDILESYQIGANSYIEKRNSKEQYLNVIERTVRYWENVTVL